MPKESLLVRLTAWVTARLLASVTKPQPEQPSETEPNELETTAPYVHWVADEEVHVPEVPLPEGWNRPQPMKLPRPTTWSPVLAFGVMLVVWGPVFTWFSTGIGVFICILALRGWIRELLHDATKG